MDVESERFASAAHQVKWEADRLALLHMPEQIRKGDFVPKQWTAWLLMEKAGMPRHLVARHVGIPEKHIARRVRAATALMMWPPYAAMIDDLKGRMTPFLRVYGQSAAGPVKGRMLCGVRASR